MNTKHIIIKDQNFAVTLQMNSVEMQLRQKLILMQLFVLKCCLKDNNNDDNMALST